MKLLTFLLFVGTATTLAYPTLDPEGNPIQECKLKKISDRLGLENALEPKPEIDLDKLHIPDPLTIKDQILTYNGQSYSFKNGSISGLSTLDYDFNYDRDTSVFNLNATLDTFNFSGEYDIQNGFVNLPLIGQHTISGSGLINAAATAAQVALQIEITTENQLVAVKSIKVGYGYDTASFKIENLTVDGKPVPVDRQTSWKERHPEIKEPMIWGYVGEQGIITLNKYLQGCTILDLIGLLSP